MSPLGSFPAPSVQLLANSVERVVYFGFLPQPQRVLNHRSTASSLNTVPLVVYLIFCSFFQPSLCPLYHLGLEAWYLAVSSTACMLLKMVAFVNCFSEVEKQPFPKPERTRMSLIDLLGEWGRTHYIDDVLKPVTIKEIPPRQCHSSVVSLKVSGTLQVQTQEESCGTLDCKRSARLLVVFSAADLK